MDIYQEIRELLKQSISPTDQEHGPLVHELVLQLKPKASEALQIAALGHDIDRCVPERVKAENYASYDEYKEAHAKRSAEILTDLMRKHNFTEYMINTVHDIVSRHEVGGTPDSDVLMEADSIAFFKDTLSWYYNNRGKKKTIKKIRFMYDRLSPRGRKIVKDLDLGDFKPLFNEALE